MNANRKERIQQFISRWTGKGYEKGESQTYWIELLQDVLGIERPTEFISFENQVKLAHTSFIDAYIPSTKVLIEQKSMDKDLRAPIRQSDGSMLTPFQQAKRYAAELGHDRYPRWVVVCNFQSMLIYDMNHIGSEPFEILLENLEKDWHHLQFMVGEGQASLRHEMEVSIKAGELVGKIYEAFLCQYGDNPTPDDLHSLNVLCVRLVFCLYAEDAGIFGKDQFYQYLSSFQPEQMRIALRELFAVLDTPVENRDRFLEPRLAAFPYVNGSLFRQNPGESIPPFTSETADILLDKSSSNFDWSEISPTIFGAVFESTLNPETRRKGGMHYTSIENIHKVIDPLFMDDLNEEFALLAQLPDGKQRRQKVESFQDKLASLKFLDPACGSGNFLTEAYISLRKLENQAILLNTKGQVQMGLEEVNPIKVNIHQFYGIEINDFAVTVATTALWIAESQMMAETESIIQFKNDFLPLKSYANIHQGNALRIDWADVVDPKELNYIIGNPPFVGYSLQSSAQKEDILSIYLDEKGKPYKTAGKIDYVAGWYWKASQLMANAAAQGHVIRTALVSTNSITQGEQVAAIWKPLYERFGIHIDFAWRTFRWDSESSLKAHVHCVIVGFSAIKNDKQSVLYLGEEIYNKCEIINFYLTEGQILFIESKSKPICNVPTLLNGGKPTEGGYLIMTEEEMLSLVQSNPIAQKWIRPYMMGKDFIERKTRFCLWMVEASPAELRQCNRVMERIENVRNYRLASPKAATRQKADTPMLFDEVRECTTNYVAIPKVSSERRRYIPMEYLPKDIIPGDKLFMLQDATLFHFGILTSYVHMAWMRAICGRLKSDYSYSNTIVYNNFPWPTPTDAQKEKIEKTAQAILDARALYPDSSLADLYDERTMPPELREAHQQNDRAVMEAYGFGKDMAESDIVAELLKMYQELTAQ